MSDQPPSDPRLEQAGASDDSIQDVHGALLREKPEPSEGTVPIPLLLLGLLSGLIFFCGIYLGRYAGGFDPMVYNEEGAPGGAAAGPVAPSDPVVVGKRLFNQNCTQCHQVTGLGVPSTYPPLAGSEWVNGTEERTIRILLHGLGGAVTVSGHAFNNAMPSFGPLGANLKDDKLAALLTYIRQEWGNKSGPVTAEQVAKVRAAETARNKAWTAAELLALGGK